MALETIGLTLQTLGEVMLGITILLVHQKISKEKRIDRKVIKEICLEEHLAVTAIILIATGYIMQIGIF